MRPRYNVKKLIRGPKVLHLDFYRNKMVDCTALKSYLSNSIKEGDPYKVNDAYRVFLANCMDHDPIESIKLFKYYEEFLDSNMPAEERASDKATISNTISNRKIKKEPDDVRQDERNDQKILLKYINKIIEFIEEPATNENCQKRVKINPIPDVRYFDHVAGIDNLFSYKDYSEYLARHEYYEE